MSLDEAIAALQRCPTAVMQPAVAADAGAARRCAALFVSLAHASRRDRAAQDQRRALQRLLRGLAADDAQVQRKLLTTAHALLLSDSPPGGVLPAVRVVSAKDVVEVLAPTAALELLALILVADSAMSVRKAAAEGICRIVASGAAPSPAAAGALLRAARFEPSAAVRVKVVQSMGVSADAVVPLRLKARDENGLVRAAAFSKLAEVIEAEVAPATEAVNARLIATLLSDAKAATDANAAGYAQTLGVLLSALLREHPATVLAGWHLSDEQLEQLRPYVAAIDTA